MIEISKAETFNWEGAIRGMRNPYKNTDKSDSEFGISSYREYSKKIDSFIEEQFPDKKEDDFFNYNFKNKYIIKKSDRPNEQYYIEYAIIGEKDLKLAQKLSNAGTPHNKFMRQIGVCMDINAPIYFWKELDTYKVGTTVNSESTMHTIINKDFTIHDFSYDDSFFNDTELTTKSPLAKDVLTILKQVILLLNTLRGYYLKETDPERQKKLWRAIIQLLPESYMQKRTWTGNYAIIKEMVSQRENHKLSEWKQEFINYMKNLPYSEELIFISKKREE